MHLEQELIRQHRLDRGWTQQQLADACGLSLRTIQRIEKSGVASLDTTAALGAVFQVELSSLLRVSPPAETTEVGGNPFLLALFSGLAGAAGGVVVTYWLLN